MPKWKGRDEAGKTVSVSDTSALGDSESKPPKPAHIPLPSAQKLKIATDTGAKHEIGLPIHVYPLYENATRAHRGQSIKENHEESAELYADFAKVAQVNVQSWNFGKEPKTKEEIATVSQKNRMICFPYPLLMNAFNNINLAGAIILTNTDYAAELGIPESQWVYPLGGAGTKDSDKCTALFLPTFCSNSNATSLGTTKLPLLSIHLALSRSGAKASQCASVGHLPPRLLLVLSYRPEDGVPGPRPSNRCTLPSTHPSWRAHILWRRRQQLQHARHCGNDS